MQYEPGSWPSDPKSKLNFGKPVIQPSFAARRQASRNDLVASQHMQSSDGPRQLLRGHEHAETKFHSFHHVGVKRPAHRRRGIELGGRWQSKRRKLFPEVPRITSVKQEKSRSSSQRRNVSSNQTAHNAVSGAHCRAVLLVPGIPKFCNSVLDAVSYVPGYSRPGPAGLRRIRAAV